jgi:hypothetical protein
MPIEIAINNDSFIFDGNQQGIDYRQSSCRRVPWTLCASKRISMLVAIIKKGFTCQVHILRRLMCNNSNNTRKSISEILSPYRLNTMKRIEDPLKILISFFPHYLVQAFLFIFILLFSITITFSQAGSPNTKCWRGICKVCNDSFRECYVTDSIGNILIPVGNESIEFTDLRNYLLVRNEKGMKGIVNLSNQIIVPLEYESINVYPQGFFKTMSPDNLVSLYDALGQVILPPDRWKIKFELIPYTYIFATRDSLYYIYNNQGKRLFNFGIKDYDRSTYMGQSCIKVTLQNGNQCLLGLPDLRDKLSKEYKKIERPKYYKNVTILTWLPNEKGEVLKQLAEGSKCITDPIYQEICFELPCLEPYKDKIKYYYIKPPKLFYAIGILPDMSMHIIDISGRNTVTMAKPTKDFKSVSEYLCDTYWKFQINKQLMPIQYLDTLFPAGVTANEAWEINSVFSSGDTIYYLGSSFKDYVLDHSLSQEESEEMISLLKDLPLQSDTLQLECAAKNAHTDPRNYKITFSQPVFTKDRNKCLLTYELISLKDPDPKSKPFRNAILLKFEEGTWNDVPLFNLQVKEIKDR